MCGHWSFILISNAFLTKNDFSAHTSRKHVRGGEESRRLICCFCSLRSLNCAWVCFYDMRRLHSAAIARDNFVFWWKGCKLLSKCARRGRGKAVLYNVCAWAKFLSPLVNDLRVHTLAQLHAYSTENANSEKICAFWFDDTSAKKMLCTCVQWKLDISGAAAF